MLDVGAPIAVTLWSAGFTWLLRAKTTDIFEPPWTWLWGGSFITVMLCHADRIVSVMATSPHDSFYTLIPVHQAGLLLLSALLLVSLFWALSVKSNWVFRLHSKHHLSLILAWLVDVVSTVLLFAVAYGISPQVYYAYYRLIIPNLPAQLVIQFDLKSDVYLNLAQIDHGNSYAELLTALSFWTLLISLCWRYLITMSTAVPHTMAAIVGFSMGGVCFMYQLAIGFATA